MPGPGDRGGKKERPKDTRGTLRRILRYLMAYRWLVLLFLIFAFLSNLGNLLGPRFAGKAIGAAEEGFRRGPGMVDMALVGRYALMMLGCYAGGNLMSFLVSIGMMRVGRRVARNMRRDVFNKLMTLPVGYFDRHQAGDIISRVSYDIDVVCTSLSTDVIQILTSLITVVGSFIMMCTISIPLVACMVVTIPLSIAFTRYMGKKTRPLYSRRSAAYGEMNGFAEEMFTGQKTILAYAQEERVCNEFSRINRKAAEAYRDADGMGVRMGPTVGMISNFGLAAIGMGGAVFYLRGIVGLAQISSFVLYSRKFSGPIHEISNIINEIFSALAASERVFRLLDEPEEAKDIYGASELTDCEGHVEADHVSFGIEQGELCIILGNSGAGKTTCLNLLGGMDRATSGRITVSGKEITALTDHQLTDYRRYDVGFVFQFYNLMHNLTALENVELAQQVCRNALDPREVMVQVGLGERMNNFPSQLSGGEQQRVSIARALCKNPALLLCDEPTGALDSRTGSQILGLLTKLCHDYKTTVVIITHNGSIAPLGNKIIRLHNGMVQNITVNDRPARVEDITW